MANMMMLVSKVLPDEVYNLAAQSHVQVSFAMPVYSAQVNALGTLHIMEAVCAASLTKTLGNLDAKWEWGHTREYVEDMWLCQSK